MTRFRPRPRGFGACARAAAAASLIGAGCGPVQYLGQVSMRATEALLQAERAEADRYARYEYVMAVEFLRKAREEAGESSFQIAVAYGRRAEELANQARTVARDRAAAESPAAGPAPASGEPAR